MKIRPFIWMVIPVLLSFSCGKKKTKPEVREPAGIFQAKAFEFQGIQTLVIPAQKEPVSFRLNILHDDPHKRAYNFPLEYLTFKNLITDNKQLTKSLSGCELSVGYYPHLTSIHLLSSRPSFEKNFKLLMKVMQDPAMDQSGISKDSEKTAMRYGSEAAAVISITHSVTGERNFTEDEAVEEERMKKVTGRDMQGFLSYVLTKQRMIWIFSGKDMDEERIAGLYLSALPEFSPGDSLRREKFFAGKDTFAAKSSPAEICRVRMLFPYPEKEAYPAALAAAWYFKAVFDSAGFSSAVDDPALSGYPLVLDISYRDKDFAQFKMFEQLILREITPDLAEFHVRKAYIDYLNQLHYLPNLTLQASKSGKLFREWNHSLSYAGKISGSDMVDYLRERRNEISWIYVGNRVEGMKILRQEWINEK